MSSVCYCIKWINHCLVALRLFANSSGRIVLFFFCSGVKIYHFRSAHIRNHYAYVYPPPPLLRMRTASEATLI